MGAYGCSACHDVYDRRVNTDYDYDYIKAAFLDGHLRSLQILIEKGLVKT